MKGQPWLRCAGRLDTVLGVSATGSPCEPPAGTSGSLSPPRVPTQLHSKDIYATLPQGSRTIDGVGAHSHSCALTAARGGCTVPRRSSLRHPGRRCWTGSPPSCATTTDNLEVLLALAQINRSATRLGQPLPPSTHTLLLAS
jgi:hypothetical protein